MREALGSLYASVDGLVVAGRTDTGVHALGNVVSADVSGGPPAERAADALDTVLPGDVAVAAAAEVPADFHARFSARSRSYRYRLYRRRERSPFEERRSWWYPWPLEVSRLTSAAGQLPGEHDFRAFTPTETRHRVFVRTIESAAWHERGEHVSSRSRPTRSSATWCGPSWERWSTASTSLRCSRAATARTRVSPHLRTGSIRARRLLTSLLR